MTRSSLLVGVVLCATVGCAPPVRRLAEQRAFDQAICAASEHSRHPERDLAFVRARLDEQARPRLHLFAIPRVELAHALGPAGERLAERVAVVRAVAAIDDVQVDDFQLRMLLVGPAGPVEPIPVHVERVAALAGETIPPAQVEVIASRRRPVWRRFSERPLLGMTAAVLEASTLFMLPVTEFTGHSRRSPERVERTEPTATEVRSAAPASSMLVDAVTRYDYARYEQGQEVSTVWLWPRPVEEDLRLVVEWSYAAYGCAGPRPALERVPLPTVEVSGVVELPLPPGPDLESRLAALFGSQMRLLAR